MKKTVFWIGACILVVGVILFSYGNTTLQNLFAMQQWDLARILQPIGLGLLALGAIMLLYGVFVKK